MKVVQLVTRNCIGGVQIVAQALDRGFRAAGHHSSVWFFCDTDEETLPTPNSTCIFVERPAELYYPRLLIRLFTRLREERPDAVIAHTTNTAVPGLVLAALAGIKRRIVVQHNPLDTYSFAARNADRLCAELGVYTSNVTVAATVSNTMGAYSETAAGRIRMIHNGMDAPTGRKKPDAVERDELREVFGLRRNRRLVATVGRLAEQKNQRVLIEAMKSLEEVDLAIAGDGPLRGTLQAQIVSAGLSDRVHMLGPLDSSKVRMLLRSCDIFATPSHFEAMPIVVLEAMQESCAIVASNIAAHTEMLEGCALLVPATAEAFADAIQELLNSPEDLTRLSRASLHRADAFSEAAMVQGYLRLLQEQ